MNEENVLQIGDFRIRHCNSGYYINLQNYCECDMFLAEKLGITYNQYKKILKQFNAYYNEKCDEYFFKELKDIIKFTEHLNEKYGVMLKLIGELDE